MTAAYPRALGMLLINSLSSVRCCLRASGRSTIGLSPEYGDRFLERADLQIGVDGGDEVGRQQQVFALHGAESGQRERDRVGAGPQIDDAVLAAPIGDGGADFLDEHRARGFDGDARQHRAGRVFHDSGNGRLGERRRRDDHEARDDE